MDENKFVVVVTHQMLGNKQWPDSYPAVCYEYKTEDEAHAAHPNDGVLMTIEQYKIYQETMIALYPDAVTKANKSPWYKFWA